MKTPKQRPVVDTWDEAECKGIIEQLWTLRQSMLASEAGLATHLQSVDPTYRASARNLVHYLTLRRHDRRDLQEWLSRVGLSSLGRAESHVMANLDKVLGILHRLFDSTRSYWLSRLFWCRRFSMKTLPCQIPA